MKHFDIYYTENCPVAREIESAVNRCGTKEENLKRCSEILKENIKPFITACLLYWAESTHWDDRNKLAALESKEIVRQFPELAKTKITDEILKEAFGFTSCAHRYLQNEFYKTILHYLEKNKTLGISEWLDKTELVYADDGKSMIPYKEYRIRKYGI